jgi:ACS family D-galactonate transporter-like MFS transporter
MEMNIQAQRIETIEQRKLPQKPSSIRYMVLILLFTAMAINYMDRASISVMAPAMKSSLNLSPAMLGLIFSAFSWSYLAMQIPGGLILDRIGSKLTYTFSLAVWSIFTAFQAFSNGFGFLFACRLLIGVAESPTMPANNRIVTTWLPIKERAFGTSAYTAGEYVGLAFATPFLIWLYHSFGWRSVFVVAGAMSFIFAIIWFKNYNDPTHSKKVNQAELAYIREGGGLAEHVKEKQKITFTQFLELLKHKQLVGLYIGQFAIMSTLVFFLTWFPTYLADEKHMTFIKVGMVASIPYIAAFCGVIFGGIWSDGLVKRGASINVARKMPVILGLFLTSFIILANYTSSTFLVISILSVAFFAQGMSNISWTMLSEVAPVNLLGAAGGMMNFFANLSGILTPITIGYIVEKTGSFAGALIYVGAIAFIGALSYIFIVGNLKRLEIKA